MAISQAQQNIILQKMAILVTGISASESQLAEFNGMIANSGGYSSIDVLIDNHIGNAVAEQGIVATIQEMAKNGYGLILTDAEA
jgi:phosphoribosylformylglycinamidine (FGAM) synthase-like amidotransferase family enzyme